MAIHKIKEHEEFELSITADSVESTDERFTMKNLSLGDNYVPINAYFKRADGTVIERSLRGNENKISNKTMPRIACQVFEEQLLTLSDKDKKKFPVCQYKPKLKMIYGIYSNED